MSKNKMDKYSIKEIHFQDNPDPVFFIWDNLSVECGSFRSKEKADLVCRLLNENEGRKNQIKLSQDEIILALNTFEDHLNYYNGRKRPDSDTPLLENLISYFKEMDDQNGK